MQIDTAALKTNAPDLLALSEQLTTLRKHSTSEGGEWSGPCPFCGGRDRYSIQPYHRPEARWLCRNCTDGKWQDVIEFVQRRDNTGFMEAVRALFGPNARLSPENAEAIHRERARRNAEQHRQEVAQQEARRAELDASGAALAYWRNLDALDKRDLWRKRGLGDTWQDYFKVGYCPARTFMHDGQPFESATLTIPTWLPTIHPDADPCITWQCINLAHRLLLPDAPGGKYRPHISGTGKALLNCDIYTERLGEWPVLLIEGEIKAMVVYAAIQDYKMELEEQRGTDDRDKAKARTWLGQLMVIGMAGKSFKPEWTAEFAETRRIWICLDPDATEQATIIAKTLGPERCRMIELPGKIDDMLNAEELTPAGLMGLIMTGKK